jgi:hypothetical protein
MIERLQDLPAGVEGVSAKGKVTAHDYRTTVWPIFEQAKRDGRHLRLLCHVADDADFTAGAAIEDARLGLGFRSLDSLQRCALVSDTRWVRGAASFFAYIAPCPIRVFSEAEWDQATEWLAAVATGDQIPHELLADSGVLVIRPHRKVDAEDIATIDATVDTWMKTGGQLNGVIIHAERFPGWESLGSFLRHARFVQDHRHQIRRLALVINGRLPELVAVVTERLVNAEVKHFAYREFSAAVDWMDTPPDTERLNRGRNATSAAAP